MAFDSLFIGEGVRGVGGSRHEVRGAPSPPPLLVGLAKKGGEGSVSLHRRE